MKRRWLALVVLSSIPLLVFLTLKLLAVETQPPKQKGITYTTWQPREYTQPYTDLSLENLAATGADWIALTVKPRFKYSGAIHSMSRRAR